MSASWSFHGTLVANTVDAVTLDQAYFTVTVTFRSPTAASAGADIYFTTDGSTPSVGGAGTYVVPAVFGATKTAKCPASANAATSLIGTATPLPIQLISTAANAFSIEGAK